MRHPLTILSPTIADDPCKFTWLDSVLLFTNMLLLLLDKMEDVTLPVFCNTSGRTRFKKRNRKEKIACLTIFQPV